MTYSIFLRVIRLAVLVVFQVLVCNQIHILGYITPLIIGYMMVCFHRESSRVGLLLWGFAIGIIADLFSNTAGMASSACTLVAMIQQPTLNAFAPRDASDEFTPTMRNMGFWRYFMYVLVLMLVLHSVFYTLDAFSLANWKMTLIAIGGATLLSTIITIFIELLVRSRKN